LHEGGAAVEEAFGERQRRPAGGRRRVHVEDRVQRRKDERRAQAVSASERATGFGM
jgi:hypothetical protein